MAVNLGSLIDEWTPWMLWPEGPQGPQSPQGPFLMQGPQGPYVLPIDPGPQGPAGPQTAPHGHVNRQAMGCQSPQVPESEPLPRAEPGDRGITL